MPTPESILANTTAIANEWRALAVAWHLALGVMIAALFAGWRPSRTTAAVTLTMPLLSVAALAWRAGNPFNGLTFVAIATALLLITLQFPARSISFASRTDVVIGLMCVALGAIYPHFLVVLTPLEYVYASPFGLIPCPTLLVITGLSIATRGFDNRSWQRTVATAALFYGVVGVAILGVTLDIALIVAALVLASFGTAQRSLRVVEGVGAVAITLTLAAGVDAHAQADRTPAAARFVQATREYAAMHRRIEQQLGPLEINANPDTIRRAAEAMAAALRAARSNAKQGDLFTPALAAELRERVNDALLEHGFTVDDIRFAESLDGIEPSTAPLTVNGSFPWKFGSAMFPCVVAALPPLPTELQYRVVGNTLVLVDIHAGLIVDLLPHALIETTVTDLDCGIFRGVTKNPRRQR